MKFELRCPACDTASECARERDVDTRIRCDGCGQEFEYRQFRECACARHRETLERLCPELSHLCSLRVVPQGS